VRHVLLLFWPRGLVFDYGTRLVGGLADVVPQFLAVAVAVIVILAGLWRRSLAAWTGVAVIAVMLPSWINMVPGQPVAEHRFYLPAGLLLALVCLSSGALCLRHARLQRPALVAVAAAAAVFGLLAVQRAALYADLAALMRSDIKAWPRGDRTHMNLGLVLEVQEDYAQAAEQYVQAAGAWEQANWRPIIALARTEVRRGDTQRAVELAADALIRVLSVPGAPDLPEYVNIMTGSFRTTGKVGLALPLLRAAMKSGYHDVLLRNQILQVSAEAGDLEGAKREFLAEADDHPVMRLNYAVALARDGRGKDAAVELDAMLAEVPSDSSPERIADIHALKGAVLGATFEGAAALEEALRLNPSHAEALNNLAWLLATAPDEALLDPDRAVELARKTVRLRPTETTFRGTLAVALAANGRTLEAETALTEAQRLGRVNGNANPELPNLVRAAAERHASNRQSLEY
jgi:tetratricopeptide (TPR) repeat protein